MAKAVKKDIYVPVTTHKEERIVTIELSERETYAMLAVLGTIAGDSQLHDITRDIYRQLEENGFKYFSVENPFQVSGFLSQIS